MGANECSQPASKSSWESQDFGNISMVLKWPIFASPPGHDGYVTSYTSRFSLRVWIVWYRNASSNQS